MNTLTNLINRIKVADFELTKANGLWVAYDLDGIEKNLIETDEQNICELLKGIGVIEGYKLVDGLLCVSCEIGDDCPRWIDYDYLSDIFEFSQKDALEIAVNHERSLIGKELTKEKDEMLTAIQNL